MQMEHAIGIDLHIAGGERIGPGAASIVSEHPLATGPGDFVRRHDTTGEQTTGE
jgi:hypothetical protein